MAYPKNLTQQLLRSIVFYFIVIGSQAQDTGFRFLTETCGEIPDEFAGTGQSTAGIFVKRNENAKEEESNLELVHSGAIVYANTVITLLKLSSDGDKFVDEDGKGLSKLFVVTGINLTDSNGKSLTQIREVDAVVPFLKSLSELKYVPALLHLKKRLNLKTPTTKSICLPLKGFFPSVADIPPEHDSKRYITVRGYANLKVDEAQDPIRFVQLMLPSPREDCEKMFGDGYSNQLYCGVPYADATNGVCATHGSADILPYDGRMFLKGLVISIPGKTCTRDDTLFFYNLISIDDELQKYFINTMKCLSRNKISCPSGECLDLNKICNKMGDCSDGSKFDEHPALCSISNPGNYTGSIAEMSQTPVLVQKVTKLPPAPENQNDRKICTVLQYPAGVELRCSKNGNQIDCSHAVEGTKLELSCKPYYQPNTRSPSFVMTCKKDGTWAPFKSFSCKAECGNIDFNSIGRPRPFISGGAPVNKKFSFPWFVALFAWKSSTSKFEYSCGGSLIESSVVVTAAHCVFNGVGRRRDEKDFRIVLAPTSSIFENNQIADGSNFFEVTEIWVPGTFDPYSFLSDIALVRLQESVQYDVHIQPVCYLAGSADRIPSTGSIGIIAGFGKDETKKISEDLKFASLPVISNSECIDSLGINVESTEFCAGFRNGTAACEGDSGGGIVFKLHNSNPQSPYVLKGIVSRGLASETGECLVNAVTVFTHFDAHGAWVLETLTNNDIF